MKVHVVRFFSLPTQAVSAMHMLLIQTRFTRRKIPSRVINNERRSLWHCCIEQSIFLVHGHRFILNHSTREIKTNSHEPHEKKSDLNAFQVSLQMILILNESDSTTSLRNAYTALICCAFHKNCFSLGLLSSYDPSICKRFRNGFFLLPKLLNLIFFYCLSYFLSHDDNVSLMIMLNCRIDIRSDGDKIFLGTLNLFKEFFITHPLLTRVSRVLNASKLISNEVKVKFSCKHR